MRAANKRQNRFNQGGGENSGDYDDEDSESGSSHGSSDESFESTNTNINRFIKDLLPVDFEERMNEKKNN